MSIARAPNEGTDWNISENINPAWLMYTSCLDLSPKCSSYLSAFLKYLLFGLIIFRKPTYALPASPTQQHSQVGQTMLWGRVAATQLCQPLLLSSPLLAHHYFTWHPMGGQPMGGRRGQQLGLLLQNGRVLLAQTCSRGISPKILCMRGF